MAVKLGNGNWAVKEDKLLAYNDNSGRFFNKEFDFARGSIATYVGKEGLIKSAASDVPRIDFSDSTNGALLLEGQSTNLITYSSDFSNSAWAKLNASVVSNNYISPDGTLNADEFVFDGTNNGRIEETLPTTNGLVYTFSIYLKNKDIANPTQVFIGVGGNEGKLVTITNEWQRFTFTQAANGTSEYPRVRYNGIGSLYAYGAQFEQQSYATSYIPTSGSATTRLADVCNNSGSAQDFNSEEGVVFYQIKPIALDSYWKRITLSDGTSTNRIIMGFDNQNNVTATVFNGSNQAILGGNYTGKDQLSKYALKYKENDFSLFINGIKVAADTSGVTFPINTLTKLSFEDGNGGLDFYGNVEQFQVFTEVLTDEQLAALTTI